LPTTPICTPSSALRPPNTAESANRKIHVVDFSH
jgi:hypothetical protein